MAGGGCALNRSYGYFIFPFGVDIERTMDTTAVININSLRRQDLIISMGSIPSHGCILKTIMLE